MIKKIVVFVMMFFVASVFLPRQTHPVFAGSFNSGDFQDYIKTFSSEENVGPVFNLEEAVEKAEEIWIKIYGERVKEEKPYQVFYDAKNGVWLVQGTLPANMMGGSARILIEASSGKVLAVWHEK